jgi:hypothetical protein
MSSNGNSSPEITASRQRIQLLVEEMPADSLLFLEQLLLFMRQHNRPVEANYRYPTVAMPATSLHKWSKLLDEGYEGDALEDSEAIYDDV